MKEDFMQKYKKSGTIVKKLIKLFYQSLEKHIKKIHFHSILEVGCGPGVSTQHLKSFIPPSMRITAIDILPEMVASSKKMNPDALIEQGSIYKLAFSDNQYELIVCLEVLEHLNDPHMGLKELSRVSSRYLVVSVPNEPLWCFLNLCRGTYIKNFGNTPGHIQHWSKKAFINLLSDYGEITQVTSPIPWTMVTVKLHKN